MKDKIRNACCRIECWLEKDSLGSSGVVGIRADTDRCTGEDDMTGFFDHVYWASVGRRMHENTHVSVIKAFYNRFHNTGNCFSQGFLVAFSLCTRIFGECSTVYSPPALFSFSSEVEISLHKLIPLFGQDQSMVAQRAEMTVTECSLTESRVSLFP